MLWCLWWADVSGYVVEDGPEFIEDTVPFCKSPTISQGNPGTLPCNLSSGHHSRYGSLLTLVFPIPALNLFMHSLLDLPLQYSSSCWFVVIGDFEDVGSVDIVVMPPSHDMVTLDVELEYWYLNGERRVSVGHDI